MSMHDLPRPAAVLLAAVLALGCDDGGDSTSPPTNTVATVTLSANDVMLAPGEDSVLIATPRAADGTALTGRTISWNSSKPGVATVSGTGLVTAVDTGTATVTATSENRTGQATIRVVEPVALVQVTPATASLQVGGTVQITATPRSASGGALTGRTVTWSSNNTTVASVSGSGLITANQAGSATVTATSGGITAPVAVTVTAGPPPTDNTPPVLAGLTLTPDTLVLAGAPDTAMASLRVTDAGSGVQSLTVNLSAPGGSPTVAVVAYAPTSGTRADGTWDVRLVVPAGSPLGTWTIANVVLYDVAGNVRLLDTAAIAALGFETTVFVRN